MIDSMTMGMYVSRARHTVLSMNLSSQSCERSSGPGSDIERPVNTTTFVVQWTEVARLDVDHIVGVLEED